MIISDAQFICSSPEVGKIPAHDFPEFAFIGRSNVGKSSLINCLCRKKLAHTSGTPGKTQLINHFQINNKWFIVDLPGYGYAKIPKPKREGLRRMIEGYVLEAPKLFLLFVLLDCRHPLQEIDRNFLLFLGENGIPFSILLTKCDKLSASAQLRQLKAMEEAIGEYWETLPRIIRCSGETGQGREEILDYIGDLLKG